MNTRSLTLNGTDVVALPTGALWWAEQATLVIADMHLGRAERTARQGGDLLPPYATHDTLLRLEQAITDHAPAHVISLGDSFDDMAAAGDLGTDVTDRLIAMAGGRRWTWIAGNHDPGPLELPGSHLAEARIGPLTFRHIALGGTGPGEVSGHFHPKARLRLKGSFVTRPCFLADDTRIILPAFGTYTGGLDMADMVFDALLQPSAVAVLTGRRCVAVPRTITAHC